MTVNVVLFDEIIRQLSRNAWKPRLGLESNWDNQSQLLSVTPLQKITEEEGGATIVM